MIKVFRPEDISLKEWIEISNMKLAEAVLDLDIEGVKEALLAGADPNYKINNSNIESYKEPILISAIVGDFQKKPRFSECNQVEIVRLLLQAGANPRAKDYCGVPALYLACDNYPIAKLLLEYGVDPNEIVSKNGKSILYCIHDYRIKIMYLRKDQRELWAVIKLCEKYGGKVFFQRVY
ncbi:ankyrin repeat domain-containing protein [Bacillus sp. FJAT-29814]|uniref:ankyrin repeat domain-containing protein n=1 Tax=Bacillus sp. FJAT-29814 TaxID=1729688 RepID=UPI00082DFD06|nr:ankyrin repeat domain-containing protein [Bacillus sp. FJAT-29814]